MTVSVVNKRKPYYDKDYTFKSESDLTSDWIRNPSWPELPAVDEYMQKVVALVAVDPGTSIVNFALRNQEISGAQDHGTFTIDWGDGTVDTLDATYNVWTDFSHTYDYTDSNLDGTNAPATITNSVITRSNHGYPNGYKLFLNDIVGPTNLSMTREYFIVNSTTNTFQLSETKNGTPITIDANGTINLLPYKLAIVEITGTTVINYFYLTSSSYQTFPGADTNNAFDWNILDIKISLPALTNFSGFGRGGTQQTRYGHCKRLETASIYNLGKLAAITSLFSNCVSLRSITTFNIPPNAISLYTTFAGCINLEQLPDYLNTESIQDMSYAFAGCYRLKKLPEMDTSSVSNMSQAFNECRSIEKVPAWDLRQVSYLSSAFQNCTNLKVVDAIFGKPQLCSNVFTACFSLKKLPKIDFSEAVSVSGIFNACYSIQDKEYEIYAPTAANVSNMFNYTPIEEIKLYAPKATDAQSAFYGCRKLRKADVELSDRVTTTLSMFHTCQSLVDLKLDMKTSKPYDIRTMFYDCKALKELPYFDTSAVYNASSAFNYCVSVEKLPDYVFTSELRQSNGMFQNMRSLQTLDNVTIDFTGIVYAAGMFDSLMTLKEYPWTVIDLSNCADISSFFSYNDTIKRLPKIIISSKCYNTTNLYAGCKNVERIPVIDNFGSVTRINNMFYQCDSLKEIPAYDMSGVTVLDPINTFHPDYSLKRFKATGLGAAGINANVYLRHGMMSAAALDELFTNLADISALPSRSITITLQPGRATANTSIATAKGWTVIV